MNCHALITWFELSRVKLYRNDQEGNKNYFELAGGSSYRGFELSGPTVITVILVKISFQRNVCVEYPVDYIVSYPVD